MRCDARSARGKVKLWAVVETGIEASRYGKSNDPGAIYDAGHRSGSRVVNARDRACFTITSPLAFIFIFVFLWSFDSRHIAGTTLCADEHPEGDGRHAERKQNNGILSMGHRRGNEEDLQNRVDTFKALMYEPSRQRNLADFCLWWRAKRLSNVRFHIDAASLRSR